MGISICGLEVRKPGWTLDHVLTHCFYSLIKCFPDPYSCKLVSKTQGMHKSHGLKAFTDYWGMTVKQRIC